MTARCCETRSGLLQRRRSRLTGNTALVNSTTVHSLLLAGGYGHSQQTVVFHVVGPFAAKCPQHNRFCCKNCPQRQDALLVNVPDHVATYLTFNGFLASTSTLASVD